MKGSRGDFVDSVRPLLSDEEPIARVAAETAGVAVIIAGPETDRRVLLIRRPEKEGDPWSGNVALPGGRVQQRDASFEKTARRETLEEVGIDLTNARFLGYLGRFQAKNRGIWVVPSVFVLDGVPSVTSSPEVASHRWVATREITDGANRSTYERQGPGPHSFPSFEFGDYLVWGLTERILSALTGQP